MTRIFAEVGLIIACIIVISFQLGNGSSSIDRHAHLSDSSEKGTSSSFVRVTNKRSQSGKQAAPAESNSESLISGFKALSVKYDGKELSDAQRQFIQEHYREFRGQAIIDVLGVVVSESGDQVIYQAINLLSGQVFADGFSAGLDLLTAFREGPTSKVLAGHAGGKLAFKSREELAQRLREIASHPVLAGSAKRELMETIINQQLVRGDFDEVLADAIFRLADEGEFGPSDLVGFFRMVEGGVGFKHVFQNREFSQSPDVRLALIEAWARAAPRDCVEMVLEDSRFSAADTEVIVNGWYENSPQDAAHWVNSLEESDAKNAAIFALSKKLVKLSPEEAIGWALSIPIRNVKIELLADLSSRMAAENGEDYSTKILSNFLSDEDLISLREGGGAN